MKLGVLCITLFLAPIIVFPQNNSLNFGIESGLTLAKLSAGYNNAVYERKAGFAEGLEFQFNLNKIISLHTGLMYEQKKTSSSLTSGTGKFNLKDNLEYLTIPLLVRATFGNKVNLFINGGPYWAFVLKRIRGFEYGTNFGYEEDLTDDTDKMEFGVAGGIGVSAILDKAIVISLEVRNNVALNDLDKDGIQTNSILILFGMAYKFGSSKSVGEKK